MSNSDPHIAASQLKVFPRGVASVVMEAVNDHAVQYRQIDGDHIRLYCGNRDVIPLKISAKREERHTLRYLLPWLEENIASWKDRKVTPEALTTLREVVSTTEVDTAPEEPEAVQPADTQEWETYFNSKGEDSGFVTNGEVYRCKDCGFERPDPRGLHLHRMSHDAPEAIRARQQAATEARVLKGRQKETMLLQAVTVLAEHHGLDLDKKEVERLQAQVEKLTAQVERLKAERDEAKARLALIQEAMKA